jgi:thermostable 8-oxoguanine DNA glycosylase
MINLQTTQDAMIELMHGDKDADLVFALRIAALSKLQSLDANERQARMLAQFTGSILPEREVLFQLLKRCGGVLFHSHLDSLYAIDRVNATGFLEHFKDFPLSLEGQKVWRDALVGMISGMSYKTVSFAALIYQPLVCDLAPIDRHHMARLDIGRNWNTKLQYLSIELEMRGDKNAQGYKGVPLGLYSAYLWGEYRDGADSDYPSHKNLSCRWY